MLSPALDQYLRLPEGVEDFHIQKLVPQFAIEAFVITVFPWTAGFDEQRFHADPPQPFAHGDSRKLGPVVRPNMIRRSVDDEQIGNAFENAL